MDSGRKMKMQGVVSQNCPKDITKHFTLPDYKAEKIAQEKEELRKKDLAEASTQVGAVKRLIEKVASISIAEHTGWLLNGSISNGKVE